ncbi:Frizzled/Smoothened family membrane region, partial [Opisthorchis viverrini]
RYFNDEIYPCFSFLLTCAHVPSSFVEEVLSNEEPGESSSNAGPSNVTGETKLTSLSENTTPCRKTSCTKTVTPEPIVFYATQAAFPFIQTPCRSRQRFHRPSKQSLDHHVSSAGFSDAFNCPKCVAVEVSHGRRHLRSKSPPSACLHLVAFAIPFVLVLISLTVAEIDGDSLSGICVVGRANIWARLGLVLIPFSVCLCVKCAYLGRLIHQMNELRRCLSKSPFIMDQDRSHRFGRCAHSYGIFLIALICLWAFSVGVQSYVLISEPAWLSSQRSLVIHRQPYSRPSLHTSLNTSPILVVWLLLCSFHHLLFSLILDSCKCSLSLRCRLRYRLLGLDENSAHLACMNTDPSIVSHTNSAFKHNNHTFQSEHSYTPTVQSIGGSQSTESIQKPRTGPILLHLLSYFALNLIFASVCLLDRSVKYCWYASFRNNDVFCLQFTDISCSVSFCSCFKFASRKAPASAEQGSSNMNVGELIETLLAGEIGGFSWWDPGIFNLPYNPLFVSNMTIVDDRCSCSAPQPNSDTKLGSPCKSAAQKKPRRSVIDSVLADTTCLSHSSSDFPSQFISVPSPSGIPNEHDLVAQLARLISYYENSAPDDPALILFRHLRQQLMTSVSSSDPRSTQSASLHAGVSQSMTFASTSHAGIPAPLSSVNVASSSFPGLPSASTHPDLVASVAAVYEQCQKQLSTLTETTSRRRNRHRRVISGRSATGNRRGYSRSLSTTGVFFPASSTVGSQKSGPSSVVSAAGSEQPGSVNDESLSLIRAAASVFAAASLRGSLNRKPRRNNQSGFDGSQASSSSMRSALTRITMPNTSNAAALSDGHGSSANDRTAPSNSRWSVYPDTNAAAEELGSRMSLRSLSCASSSGAESYNSYRLLVNQAGASWRELWRTRMLLMDVLRWVEVVAPMMQLQRKRRSSDLSAAGDDGTSVESQEPLPQHKSAMNWESALASLVSTLSLPQQTPGTSCQPQQSEGTAWSPSASYEIPGVRPPVSHDPAAASLNPMLAAAFAAATAAATLALQHQNEVAPSREPPSTDSFSQNIAFPRSPSQQQQQIFPPKMSPAVHLHPVWSDQYPMTHPHSWSQLPVPPVPPNQPLASTSQSPVCASQPPQFPCSSSSVRFNGAPDLLLDHDRYRLTAFSPSCTPPFVPGGPSPRTPSILCRSPPSVQPFPYLIPTYASWQQVPFRPPFCPPPASQVQEFPIQNIAGSVVPPVPVQYVPTETGEPRQSKSLHDNGSNDSDAFDSEEEVISDDETPGMTDPKLSPTNAHSHLPHMCQVPPDNFIHDFSQYPHPLESSRYCPPSHFPGEPFFNSVDRSLAESDIANVDDGDLSSVSQSASQVVPRESSPSSALPTVEDPEDFTSEPACSPSQALVMNDKLPHKKHILDGVETTN